MDVAAGIQPIVILEDVEAGCLHELFEAQVALRPEAPALICGERVFSYAELEGRSNQLARYLMSRGAKPGTFVGIFFERSEQPIIVILACLKAGVAYVPIDPTFPVDRIRHIQEEAELLYLLTDESLLTRAQGLFTVPVLSLLDCHEEVALESTAAISREASGLSPEDLCYVIYTSGTTGRPKGVMTEHRGAYRYALAFNEVCGTSTSDRIYQGFSLGFDGSIEEIWMAFSNGSTLVVGTRETPRFGNELGEFLAQEGITYFSTVPTLLATLTATSASDLPKLKTLIVSGEICSQELVNRWVRPGLRMLNVYGPTEATVNTTAAECVPGRPVTIGRPLKDYEIFILNPFLQPVDYGEKGELFVGGQTLARGYLKRPDLTAERFISIEGVGAENATRLYRTGDLVRWNQDGELEFFGRIDSQVKIRGYRVELSEIESILLENEHIRSATVKLFEKEGLQELAAYVLVDPATTLDRDDVLVKLEARLPPYMVPGFLEILDETPRLASGKVDRSRLPAPVSPLVRTWGQLVPPATPLEAQIARLWTRVFGLSEVSVESDFFLDLGGHSLIAAQMVTLLRNETSRPVAVRDAYQFPTVRKLAAHLEAVPERAESNSDDVKQAASRTRSAREAFDQLSKSVRMMTATLQAVSIYLLYGIGMVPAGGLFLLGRGWVQGAIALHTVIVAGLSMLLLTWPVLLLLGIAAKWLIIGRYKPGSYPVWGFYFFRWWLVGRIQALSGAAALTGTPWMAIYYRLMGARVGRGCTLDTALCSIWDLVSIGEDTSIGADTQLLGYRIENGMLHLGQVEIGKRCFIGIHSALGLDVRMGDDARLDDQSLLADRQIIGHGESRRGSPARVADVQVPGATVSLKRGSRARRAALGIAQLVLIELLAILMIVPMLPLLMFWGFAFLKVGAFAGVASLIASVPLAVISYSLFIAGVKRTFLNSTTAGVYPVESVTYLKKWLSDDLMKLSRSLLLPLYTTIYFPTWLRLMGAKIGARAELSTVWQFSPELVEVGEESFFADGSIIGGKRIFGGHFEVAMNRIGRRSFVGNSAVLPVGASLGNGCLLGVQSIPPAETPCTPDGTDWLGSPSFSLPHRQKVGGFDDSVTFRPTKKLYVQRLIIDALRILIPGYIALSAGFAGVVMLNWVFQRLGVISMFLLAPAIGLLLGFYAILAVVALKKAVMGTFKPVIVPLWSMYVWLNEMLNGAYESVMTPALGPFLGTPFIAPLLRLIGCKIGQHTYIDTTHFSEFDLVKVGDYAALNVGSIIQNHLFEDRVMKSSYLDIGSECSVGNMAVVLYDSEMQPGASIGPLSLLMKGEMLAARTRSHGIPTVQLQEVAPESKWLREPLGYHEVSALGIPTRLKPASLVLVGGEANSS